MATQLYLPVREWIPLSDWPVAGLLPEALDNVFFGIPEIDPGSGDSIVEILFPTDLSLHIPGLDWVTIAIGGVAGATTLKLRYKPSPFAIAVEALATLRVAADVLRPVGADGKPDMQATTLDIVLGAVGIVLSESGDLSITLRTTARVPKCTIGSTGVVIEARSLRWLSPATDFSTEPAPANMSQGFTGLYLDGVTVDLPGLTAGVIGMSHVFIGTGGFSGAINLSPPPNHPLTWNGNRNDFENGLHGDLFGFKGGLSKVKLVFTQSAVTECDVQGNVFVPYLDRVIGLSLGLDGNGGITAVAQAPTCRFTRPADAVMAGPQGYLVTANTDAFTLDISRIEFHASGDAPAEVALSGRAKLKMPGFDVPAVVFKGLRIDTQGHVAVEGGWLDVEQAKSANLKGFPFQITRIGFGADSPRKRWIGLNGGIKLADGLPIGVSVEGLRVNWDLDNATRPVSFSLAGIGLELRVPNVYSFAGKVAFFENEQASGFRGTLKLKLETVKVTVDASLVVGRTRDGTAFFYFYLDLELPTGVPLFTTGAAIYGFSGLLAANMTPARADGENWYHGYYKRPLIGVTDAAKWTVQRGGFALGLGTTIGSLPDTGFSISAKVLMLLVLPGPQLLLQGKGNFLKKKPAFKAPPDNPNSTEAEGSFEALLVLDVPAKLFQANLAVAFRIVDLVEASGGLDAAFSWSPTPPDDLWHVYLGEKSPAERRLQAKLVKIFQGDSWLMVNRTHRWPPGLPNRVGDFELGGSISVNYRFDFTIVKAWLDASITGQAAVTWNPQQFNASLTLQGSAGISALGLSIVANLLADAQAKAPSPWHVSILIEVGIKIDLVVTKWEFASRLPLEFGDPNSPLPEPVTNLVTLFADHAKVDEAHLLDSAMMAPDARPIVTFDRPVQDRARFGAPGLDNVPAEDLGLRQFSYRLTHVVLLTKNQGSTRLMAAAGELTITGTTVTFGGLTRPEDQLPDLAGAELTLIAPGQTIGPIAVLNGSGSTATITGNAPQGTYSYRMTAPRPRAAVQVDDVRYNTIGIANVTLAGPINDPVLYRGGKLRIGAASWLVLDANANALKVRVDNTLPSVAAATLEAPAAPILDGKWYPAGDPVNGPDSSTRLQVWAKTPYSFFRHNELAAINGLDAFRPDYACGPDVVEDPLCTRFEDVASGRLAGTFQTAGIEAIASQTVTAMPVGTTGKKQLQLGNFTPPNGSGTVTFTFDPPVDAVWVTAEAREGGRITALFEGHPIGHASVDFKVTRYEFNGGIDRVEVTGTAVTIQELCLTPGWICTRFSAASFPNHRSGSLVYAGMMFSSDGLMAVDNDTLEVDPTVLPSGTIRPVIPPSEPMGMTRSALIEDSAETAVFEATSIRQEGTSAPSTTTQPLLTLPIAGLVKPVTTMIPGLGPVHFEEGFFQPPVPGVGNTLDPRITLLPDSLTKVEPWRDRERDPNQELPLDPGKIWVGPIKVSIVTLTVQFPKPVTRVRVRLNNDASVVGFAEHTEVIRVNGVNGSIVSLHVQPGAPSHLGWIDRIVIIAAGQVRISELCTDAGDFGWRRHEQWKWSQSVRRSVESLYSSDPVLSPGAYQLRVHTATEVTGAQPQTIFQRTDASFTIGAPPGFATAPTSGVAPSLYPQGGPLTDLSTYVADTMPPAGTVGWYRSYDTAVRFNENYITRMYLEAGYELGVWVVNASHVPLRPGARHVWSGSSADLDAWTDLYVRTLNGDGTDPCATVNLDKIVRPEQLTVGGGEPLEPARLHASELRTLDAAPRVLHRFEFTTSAYTGFRHHLLTFDGRCRRLPRDAAALRAVLSPAQRVAARVAQQARIDAAITSLHRAKSAATADASQPQLDAVKVAHAAVTQLRQETRALGISDFDAVWAACFGTAKPHSLPPSLKISIVESVAQSGNADVLLLESPEPIAWERVRLNARRLAAVPLRMHTAIINTEFGRPDKDFEIQFGGLLWRAGVELWVQEGALRARADEPMDVSVDLPRASRVEFMLRVDADGSANISTTPALPGGTVTQGPSTATVRVALAAPSGTAFDSVRVTGRGVAIETCTVTGPFIPVPPTGLLRIAGIRLPTRSKPLDHEVTVMAMEATSTAGYQLRWFDALAPDKAQPYAVLSAIDLKAGQRLRLVPALANAPATDDALVQAGGPGVSPPATGAVFQLVDPAGRVSHECVALPTGGTTESELGVFPNHDGTCAFIAVSGSAPQLSAGYWVLRATFAGDVGPHLATWSIAGRAVSETIDLGFFIA